MVKRLSVFLLFSIILALPAQAATLTASVDRKQISEQDTFSLLLRYAAQAGFSSPDLTPLQQDFQILNQQQSRRISTVNGKTESYTDWVITLSPKRTGTLTIPPLSYDDGQTDPITIEVSRLSDDVRAQQQKEFFFDISVSQQDTYYVQGQILYTEKLYFSANHDDATLSEFKVTDARVQPLGDVRQYTTVIDGQRFGVYERRYAIFPEVSGELVIPGQRFSATVSNPYDRWTRGRQASAVSKPIRLTVSPIPAGYPQAPWLPAGKLTLSENFSADFSHWRAGEPVTRTLTLSADGLPGSQLPAIPLPALDQVRYYPDQTQQDEQVTDNGITGSSVQSMALVPTRDGQLELPEIRVPWWNTHSGKLEYAVLPAHTIQVATATQSSAAGNTVTASMRQPTATSQDATASLPAMSTSVWWWLLLGTSVLLNLVLLILLLRRPRTTALTAITEHTTDNAAAAWQALSSACRAQDIKAIHSALLSWANAAGISQQPIRNLQQLALCYPQPAVKAALAELDAVLFSGQENSACNTQNLLALLKQQQPAKAGAEQHATSLYPA